MKAYSADNSPKFSHHTFVSLHTILKTTYVVRLLPVQPTLQHNPLGVERLPACHGHQCVAPWRGSEPCVLLPLPLLLEYCPPQYICDVVHRSYSCPGNSAIYIKDMMMQDKKTSISPEKPNDHKGGRQRRDCKHQREGRNRGTCEMSSKGLLNPHKLSTVVCDSTSHSSAEQNIPVYCSVL